MVEPPKYISAATIMTTYLGIGRRTLERWIAHPRSGFPQPAIRSGGKADLFSREAVEKWLEAQASKEAQR